MCGVLCDVVCVCGLCLCAFVERRMCALFVIYCEMMYGVCLCCSCLCVMCLNVCGLTVMYCVMVYGRLFVLACVCVTVMVVMCV